MGDWDPFADPADVVEPAAPAPAPAPAGAPGSGTVPAVAVGVPRERHAGDIFDALEALEGLSAAPAAPALTQEAREALLAGLLAARDGDAEALRAAFEPVVAGEDGLLNLMLWRRALPILMDPAEHARHRGLLALLLDQQCGLLGNGRAGQSMGEVGCEVPPEPPADGVVIFLFGWGGGTARDLDDIAGLYRELFPGAVIVRLMCNMKGSFGLRCECAFGIRAASHAWAHMPTGIEPKLLVHLFSNAGFMTWTEMLQCWQALSGSGEEPHRLLAGPLPGMAEVLRGVILDSACNSQIRVEACIRSQVQAMAAFVYQVGAAESDGSEAGRKAADHLGKKAMMSVLGSASPVRAHLAAKPEEELIKQSAAEAGLVHELEPPVKMQFIYSRDDNIIESKGIEQYLAEVIARPSRRGIPPPQRLVFEKSKHALHKVVHKEEYWKCVRLFASSVTGG